MTEAIEDAGFEAEVLEEDERDATTLRVAGMTCSSCSASVEKALLGCKGVHSAAVNLITGVAEVSPYFVF